MNYCGMFNVPVCTACSPESTKECKYNDVNNQACLYGSYNEDLDIVQCTNEKAYNDYLWNLIKYHGTPSGGKHD